MTCGKLNLVTKQEVVQVTENEKYNALNRAWKHLTLAWNEVYEISKEEHATELTYLRNSINNLEVKCLDIRDSYKGGK